MFKILSTYLNVDNTNVVLIVMIKCKYCRPYKTKSLELHYRSKMFYVLTTQMHTIIYLSNCQTTRLIDIFLISPYIMSGQWVQVLK